MTSTRMSAARRTVAVAAAALLFAAGCDDGAQESAPPEAPAEQGADGAGEESAGGESGATEEADEDAEQEQEQEQDGAEGGPDDGQDDDGGEESGEVEEISETPCADLTPEDIGAVVGNEVGDREEASEDEAPAVPDGANLISCMYPGDAESTTASLFWNPPIDDLPEEMPEEARERHDESRAHQLLGDGEEIDVEGASAATVEISTALGVTQVTIKAAVGGAVLTSSLVAVEGLLDESDIPTAVELAELAISKA